MDFKKLMLGNNELNREYKLLIETLNREDPSCKNIKTALKLFFLYNYALYHKRYGKNFDEFFKDNFKSECSYVDGF